MGGLGLPEFGRLLGVTECVSFVGRLWTLGLPRMNCCLVWYSSDESMVAAKRTSN